MNLLVDLRQSGLTPLRLTLRRPQDDRPARGVQARRALHWRTVVAFHKDVSLLPTITGESLVRNKILKLCNAKGLIPIMTASSTLGGTAKPIWWEARLNEMQGAATRLEKGLPESRSSCPARFA